MRLCDRYAPTTLPAEAEGLEPPRDFSRRISSAVPYQLGYASQNASDS